MDRENVSQEVVRWANDWIAAERRGDTMFLAQNLAEDFVAVGPLGFTLTKQAWLDRHQSGAMRYTTLDMDDVTVRLYDGVAVAIGRQVQDATFRGNPVKAELRTSFILVGQQGQWQLAGVHMSSIGQPPSFARP
jgi:hypothetical protein